jgi:hypothetical protein
VTVTTADASLDEVLTLSAAMLESARQQDWASVANLESTRNVILHAMLDGLQRPSATILAEVLPKILESDRAVIALGESVRSELAGKLLQFRQGRRARSAYSDHNGD